MSDGIGLDCQSYPHCDDDQANSDGMPKSAQSTQAVHDTRLLLLDTLGKYFSGDNAGRSVSGSVTHEAFSTNRSWANVDLAVLVDCHGTLGELVLLPVRPISDLGELCCFLSPRHCESHR